MLLVAQCQDIYGIHLNNFTELPKLITALREYHRFETADKLEKWLERLLYHHEKEYDEAHTEAQKAQ